MERRGSYRYVYVSCIVHAEVKWIQYDNLRAGKSKGCANCGVSKNRKYNTNIEKALSKRYHSMIDRCYNQNNPRYHDYGGRGIRVHDSLRNCPDYVSYCISLPGADISLEIDRIDNNGNYEPGNLRWVDRKTNTSNTRRNIYVIYNDKRMVFTDYVRNYTNISLSRARIYLRRGWTLEQIAEYIPEYRGRRIQSIRSGKLRADESVHGRSFQSNDSP